MKTPVMKEVRRLQKHGLKNPTPNTIRAQFCEEFRATGHPVKALQK